jgi:branched-chain amino acid transport system substrate-binding protein
VLVRGLGLAALAAAALSLAGCAGVEPTDVADATGSQLAIYSSLPFQGPSATISQQIVNGEKLALSDAGGRAGDFKIGFVSLDDANPKTSEWSPDVTATDAKTAAEDTSTIAYLGDYDSPATAVSLPLINAAGILQISPASPYVGLTSSRDAGQDEPERFYPTGKRNFARLQPGDPVQAAAQAQLMRSLDVHTLYVLNGLNAFDLPLAELVAEDAKGEGIKIDAHDEVATALGTNYKGEIEKITESGAQAVFFSGEGAPGTAALWRGLHSADPRLLLLGSSSLASEAFTAKIGAAASTTYLSTPALPTSLYPASAQQVLDRYRRQFGGEASAYVLYGYEAMTVVLDAIRNSGSRGDDRETVIKRFFATRDRDSVLGRYSIEADGETTLARYGIDRVSGGQPVFYRAIEVSPAGSDAGR